MNVSAFPTAGYPQVFMVKGEVLRQFQKNCQPNQLKESRVTVETLPLPDISLKVTLVEIRIHVRIVVGYKTTELTCWKVVSTK